ncbi:MAG: class I SAM-dependent methyltransferase [Gemmatimonadaceae bacterium]
MNHQSDGVPVPPASTKPGADVSAAYDRWSVQYDNDRNATRDLDAQILRKAPIELFGRDVLELGCGTGKNTVWLAESARHVTSLDFSAGMLSVARERVRAANVQFMQHDVRELWPVADNSVDVVVGNLVLEHVEDLLPVYHEAARVLRSGGQLYFCELHPFRQMRGGQAHFTEQSSNEIVRVSAYAHSVSDYVNSGIQSEFGLQEIGEWLENNAAADAAPRIFSVLFRRAPRQ